MNDRETLFFPEEREDRVVELERRSGALYMYKTETHAKNKKER